MAWLYHFSRAGTKEETDDQENCTRDFGRLRPWSRDGRIDDGGPGLGAAINTKNEALVKAINDAQSAAKAQNWTAALEKAKEADAIKDDKPAALNPIIHQMIISYAINAHDYAAAMATARQEHRRR